MELLPHWLPLALWHKTCCFDSAAPTSKPSSHATGCVSVCACVCLCLCAAGVLLAQCQISKQRLKGMAHAESGVEMPREKPEAWVSQKCKVFWPDDAEWYDAVVRAYDRSNGKHNVWYSYDQQVCF